MNEVILLLGAYFTGAIVGSIATWIACKKYYGAKEPKTCKMG